MEVRLEHLMPGEADQAQRSCPALFIPLGTIEWHGAHNVLGLDALKAHALCVQGAQRGGGLVHPPVYGGVGGLEEPHTFVFDPEPCLRSVYLRPWLEQLCSEGARQGFRAIIILTGHYGAAQQIAVRECAVRMSRVLDVPVLGLPEYFLALDEGYYGDHAGFFETSIMMHLFPDRVDLDRLGDPPHQGVSGDPRRNASADEGRRFCEAIVERLARLAVAMPAWDLDTRQRFARAEEAFVARQLELAQGGGTIWAAWDRVHQGALDDYPRLLVEGAFDELHDLVTQVS